MHDTSALHMIIR